MIDTHCHLNHPQFQQDACEVIERARQVGVRAVLVVGYDHDSNARAAELTANDGVWAGFGLHPHDASASETDSTWLAGIRALFGAYPRAVAVGEIGLDFHYMHSPEDVQREVLRQQLHLATEMGLPVTLHSRAAEDDVMDILEQEGVPAAGAVLHSFTGTAEQMRRAVSLGLHIGVTGMIAFKNAPDVRSMLAAVPPERLLMETDAPYLAPPPHRGKRNEPAYLVRVRAAMAELYGLTEDEIERITDENALAVFSRMRS